MVHFAREYDNSQDVRYDSLRDGTLQGNMAQFAKFRYGNLQNDSL